MEWDHNLCDSLAYLHLFLCTFRLKQHIEFLKKFSIFVREHDWMLAEWATDLVELGYFEHVDYQYCTSKSQTWILLMS